MPYIIILAIAAIFYVTGFSDTDGTERLLHESGYKSVQVQGYAFVGCDEGHHYRTAFTAVTEAGESIAGSVCATRFGTPVINLH